MSTITVVRKGGSVAIASDSMGVYGSLKLTDSYTIGDEKIFKGQGSWFGVAGYAVCGQVWKDVISRKGAKLDFDSRERIFSTMLKLHPMLKKKYYMLTSSGDEENQPFESSQVQMLVANPHGIFEVLSWREVTEFSRFWAIGSGRKFALGAMGALYDTPGGAGEIALAGVEAGCEFDSSSGRPGYVREMKLKKGK